MKRRPFSRTAICSLLATAAIVMAAGPATAQDSETPAQAKKFRGRLPAYYGPVVDEEQRQAIYDIQREYHPQIAALKAQLEALIQQRDEKVEAVLTPEQLEKVEAAKAAAAAKRAKKAASAVPKSPAGETSGIFRAASVVAG